MGETQRKPITESDRLSDDEFDLRRLLGGDSSLVGRPSIGQITRSGPGGGGSTGVATGGGGGGAVRRIDSLSSTADAPNDWCPMSNIASPKPGELYIALGATGSSLSADAATDGIYKSTNFGDTWELWLAAGDIHSSIGWDNNASGGGRITLYVPDDGSLVMNLGKAMFAGDDRLQCGVWRVVFSTKAVTHTLSPTGSASISRCRGAVDGNGTTLYASVTEGTVGSSNTIDKSTNGGASWSGIRLETSSTKEGMHHIWVDPATPEHVIVFRRTTSSDFGIDESTDGGTNWTGITWTVTDSTKNEPPVSLLQFSVDWPKILMPWDSTGGGSFVYAEAKDFNVAAATGKAKFGTLNASSGNNLISGGKSLILEGDTSGFEVYEMNGLGQAALLLSTVTATLTNNSGGNIGYMRLNADRFYPHILYATFTTGGVFRSLDSGRTWIQKNEGLP